MFIYFIFTKVLADNSNFNEMIRYTDKYLLDKDYNHAKKTLNLIKKVGLSRHDWTRVLNRYFKIARANGNYKDLSKMTFLATYFYPDANEFWALRVKSLIILKNYKKAKEIAIKYLSNGSFNEVRTEAIFMSIYKGDIKKVVSAISKVNDPDVIHTFAEELGLNVLYYNEALLWLEKGDKSKVRPLLEKMKSKDIPVLGSALIAYDIGNYYDALDILTKSDGKNEIPFNPPRGAVSLSEEDKEDILKSAKFIKTSLMADVLLMTKAYDMAYEYYLESISLDPKKFYQAWINIAILSEQLGKNIDVISWYKNALLNFPTQKTLSLSYTMRLGNNAEAKKIVENLLAISPNDPELNIYWFEFFDKGTTVNKRSAELWNMYNNFSFHSELAEYMIWFFSGIQDYESARMVIDYYTGNDKTWVDFYDALIDMVFKDYDKALNKFQNLIFKHWESYYNIALIYIYKGEYKMALANIDLAEKTYNADLDLRLDYVRSRFYVKRGEIYVLDRNKEKAIECANKAIEFYPNNVEAKRVLNDALLLF